MGADFLAGCAIRITVRAGSVRFRGTRLGFKCAGSARFGTGLTRAHIVMIPGEVLMGGALATIGGIGPLALSTTLIT